MKNQKEYDPFDEEDWNEGISSMFSLGAILDELQSGKINDEEIKNYINIKSEVSSKNDPVKELLFLKDYVSLLSAKVNSFVYKRLIELKKEKIEPKDKDGIIKVEKDLISIIEISKIISVSRQQVYNYINNGSLKAYQIGKKGLRVSKKDLEDFISVRKKI